MQISGRDRGDTGAAIAPPCVSRLRIDDQSTEPEWDQYVGSHAAASVYHQWGWRRVFARAFEQECVYLSAKANSAIVGVLPLVLFQTWMFGRFAVSLPFVNYGGVIADSEPIARALLERAHAVARDRRLSYVELRHVAAQFPELPAKRHKVAMCLTLPANSDALWQRLDRKVRNQIRTAEKSELTVTIGGAELVADFYSVFSRNMRDLGTPVYPRQMFETVLAEFSDSSRIFVVRRHNEPVAASGTLQWRNTIEGPWASSLRDYRSMCPNMLLYWSMLQHAVRSGCTTFDFGRSTPNEGSFFFKRQWGAEAAPLTWEYQLLGGQPALPGRSPADPRFRLLTEVWKRLPLPVATALGPRIVRSIP